MKPTGLRPPLIARYVGQAKAMGRERHHKNVPGPFYVEAGCCLACGVPEATAPALFDEDDESHCFVKRQPGNQEEVDRMLLTIIRSEVGCIRYCGTDERIIRRLAEQGEGQLSDLHPSPGVSRIHRDHVGLRNLRKPVSASELMDAFIAHLRRQVMPERYRFDVLLRSDERSELRVTWFEETFHSFKVQRSSAPEFDWLIVGLEYFVHDWLAEDPIGTPTFFESADWNGNRSSGHRLPW